MMNKKIFFYGLNLTIILLLLTGCTNSGNTKNTVKTSNTTNTGDIFSSIENDEDENIDKEVVINVDEDSAIYMYESPSQNTVSNNTTKKNPEANNVVIENTNTNTTKTNQTDSKVKSNSNTTNDDETAKEGNSGKYAYVSSGKFYDTYWIIDFDEGYVYDFTERNDDDSCEKIKIKSGDLNTGLKLSYKDPEYAWAQDIHFKAKNFPNQIVIVDNDGFDNTFSSTNIEDALNYLGNKEIWEP